MGFSFLFQVFQIKGWYPMRNKRLLFTDLFPRTASMRGSRMRPRHWILCFSLFAALLSSGCPKQDPLQAFNNPTTATGNPVDPANSAPAPVPEPVTALLFGTALLIGGGILRRRRKKNIQ
jgi:hypothetical protein